MMHIVGIIGAGFGILPEYAREEVNPYIDIPIVTGFSEGCNVIVARISQVLVAIAWEYGTLSEIALASKMGRRVIGLPTWAITSRVIVVESPKQAVEKALAYLDKC